LQAQRPDGGWRLAELGNWKIEPEHCDAYATGLCAYVVAQFEEDDYANAAKRGARWLATHQDRATGAWPVKSVNQDRDGATMPGQFMQDAGTAFAVLALTTIEW
jgi:hypothetical protein